ncbi:hypothetical protein [Massilia genomosp. 1]|uniref:Flagellar protein FlgJ N-terminal domain-containing protein n=1 Tax=Massilia genomosp. 1 TaxID=2609280 RepID=A0ABX0MI17_9BURK|nr:hypothetical protein [Massilia genomosp. 1]NHZ62393.1 hypothetical protein [Massilia genomosp. 1]
MKIDTATSPLYSTQTTVPVRGPAPADTTPFQAALSTAATAKATQEASGARQADFTSMTRQDMRNWANGQIRSGQMSLDEGRPFMAMTMKIPVGGGAEVPAEGDGERIDFTRKVGSGIEGAISRNDQVTRKMLESAMDIMRRKQGRTLGIDTSA